MKPSARLVKVFANATLSSPGDGCAPTAENPTAETTTTWRVWPLDLDLYGHMNNSRYLLLMDYARIDYLGRLGLVPKAVKNRWVIPVGSAQVDFRGALRPFAKFTIGTQVLSWDDRWFCMRQTFRSIDSPQRPVATAHVKVTFRDSTGRLSPASVVRMAVGEDVAPPRLDDDARARFGLPPRLGVVAPLAAS